MAIEKYTEGARRLTWQLTQYMKGGCGGSSPVPSPPPIYSQFSLVSNIKGRAKQVPSMLKTRTSVLSFHKTAAMFPGSFVDIGGL